MWYLYIVKCSDGMLYTGITTDVTARVKRHNQKKASKYTRARLPVKMLFSEPHETKTSALKREHQLKKLTRAKKLALIQKNQ